VPSAWYQHGLASRRSWIDRLATLLPARAILTCSATSAASQSRLGPRRALHIAYPGVDLERFDPAALPSPDALRRRLGLPAGGPLIGIIGRLQRWKGMHTLLEAMPAVLRRHPDAHGVIVGGAHRGEAAYPAYLRERIAGLHLEEHVTMTGQQANIPEWMQAMDVVVHASDREPFGIVLLEAMALGKPVVAGDRGGPTEVITDGVDGLLTPYGDAQALAGAILRYLDDPAFARRTGSAARARARAFALPSTTQKLVGTIACLGSSHGQARRGVNPTVTRETG
jgi:glycosyltransferase involved in cell wall biosynthesis